MSAPIVVFYHGYIYNGSPPDLVQSALTVVHEQMERLRYCGLADAASEIVIGLNGGQETLDIARLIAPEKARIVLHGLESKNENPTLVLLEEWLKSNPQEAHVLYFHAKGASHDPATAYGKFDAKWRECLMRYCIEGWRQCVSDLASYEAVGCHWLTGQGSDHSQHYFAGTFFWARASFLRTLPSIFERERIKVSGLSSPESRYEIEVWIGNGPRRPYIRDYADHGLGSCP